MVYALCVKVLMTSYLADRLWLLSLVDDTNTLIY